MRVDLFRGRADASSIFSLHRAIRNNQCEIWPNEGIYGLNEGTHIVLTLRYSGHENTVLIWLGDIRN